MVVNFSDIDTLYADTCELLRSSRIKKKYFEDFHEFITDTTRKGGEICVVGSGRMEKIAGVGALFFVANHYRNIHCSSDDTYPPNYESNDLVIALSGSGETPYTLDRVRPALEVGAKIIAITANKNSTLSEYTGENGLVVPIKAKHKKEKKKSKRVTPLEIEGTDIELRTLNFFLDYFGYRNENTTPRKFHNKFINYMKRYTPEPEEFEKAYEILPKPDKIIPKKTILVGEGLSGKIASMVAIRYSHIGKEDHKRPIYFYKDSGSIALDPEDGLIIFSVSGRGFPLDAALKGKNKKAKIVSYTSQDSPLEKNSDVTIHIPEREEGKPKGAIYHFQANPINCIPEFVTLLYSECYICKVAEIEGITDEDFSRKHPEFT